MAVMGISIQIKTDNASAYVLSKVNIFFLHFNINIITGIPHNTTGQASVKISHHTLKDML